MPTLGTDAHTEQVPLVLVLVLKVWESGTDEYFKPMQSQIVVKQKRVACNIPLQGNRLKKIFLANLLKAMNKT